VLRLKQSGHTSNGGPTPLSSAYGCVKIDSATTHYDYYDFNRRRASTSPTTATTTLYDEGRYADIFFFDFFAQEEKNLLIPAAAGSSPSMQPLVFWPLLLPSIGVGAVFVLSAHEPLAGVRVCVVYDMDMKN